MKYANTLRELKASTARLQNWTSQHLPPPHQHARLLEFATMFSLVEQIRQATGSQPVVHVGPKKTFAGSPANRKNYNWIQVDPFIIYFGVKFAGQSGVMHAPDVVLAHKLQPNRPLIVFECKHYSGKLPKVYVMAFVGLLCDLHWTVFAGCKKAARVSGSLYPGDTLLSMAKASRGSPDIAAVCEALNMCKSHLVTTTRVSAQLHSLQWRYEFVIDQTRRWV